MTLLVTIDAVKKASASCLLFPSNSSMPALRSSSSDAVSLQRAAKAFRGHHLLCSLQLRLSRLKGKTKVHNLCLDSLQVFACDSQASIGKSLRRYGFQVDAHQLSVRFSRTEFGLDVGNNLC